MGNGNRNQKHKPGLAFRQDGTFTIVQFTDIHWIDGSEPDQRSLALMEAVVRDEAPDLVFYTGDIIYTGGRGEGRPLCTDPFAAFASAVSAAESNGIPWAAVFGNHDTEEGVTRAELAAHMERFDWSVSETGPDSLSGHGNFTLRIAGREGNAAAVLYGFDSGDYSKLPHVRGYDWIKRDQIEWYARQSRGLTESNGGVPVPALSFFHIPLPEYKTVWETAVCYGHKHESVCSPALNSGMFTAMTECGDVMGVFCGHDHINDYWGELCGIRLCYGRATGYHTYGREGFPRGARVIRLKEGERSFESWLWLDDGSVVMEQPEHAPHQE